MLNFITIAAAFTLASGAAHASHDHGDGNSHAQHMNHKDHKQDAMSTDTAARDAQAAHKAEIALRAAVADGGELIVVDVLGVVCDFCATAMNKTFAKRKEVATTYVDLDTKTLSIVTKPGATLDDKTIDKLVKKSGYKLSGVRRDETLPPLALEGAAPAPEKKEEHAH
jgi:hypothetical protein